MFQPHEQRVVEEKSQLDEKIKKLSDFFAGPVYPTLPNDDRILLIEQRTQMMEYSNTLMKRIARFNKIEYLKVSRSGTTITSIEINFHVLPKYTPIILRDAGAPINEREWQMMLTSKGLTVQIVDDKNIARETAFIRRHGASIEFQPQGENI